MTHDPLCPNLTSVHDCWIPTGYVCTHDCQCPLITRVREDERKADASGIIYVNQVQMQDVLIAMRRIGYAAALRNAVEAVNGLPSANYMPHPGYTDDQPALWRDQVVAAIEALNE